MFQRYLVVSNAAREGARVAVLPGYTAGRRAEPRHRLRAQWDRRLHPLPSAVLTVVTIDPPGATPPFPAAQVSVSITHSYWLMGPVSGLLGGGSWTSITLAARSTMRIES